MKRLLGVAVAASFIAGVPATGIGAQIIQPVRLDRPIAYTSLSAGWFQPRRFCDGSANACWDFGSALQWRASLEIPLGNGGSWGVAGTVSRVPLIYSGSTLDPTGCSGCNADANVAQYLGMLHLGGSGQGLRQIFDLSAGITAFSNFRRESDGSALGSGTTKNFTFAVGYGFSYGFSRRMELMLVQDAAVMVHKAVTGSADNSVEQFTLRAGLRVGLGDK